MQQQWSRHSTELKKRVYLKEYNLSWENKNRYCWKTNIKIWYQVVSIIIRKEKTSEDVWNSYCEKTFKNGFE